MKRIVIYLMFLSLICSCSILKKNNTFKDNHKIIGFWTEHWDIDSLEPTSRVDYVDTLKIDMKESGKIEIACINRSNYVYSDIIYNDSQLSLLSFQMENKADPKEKFRVYYSLVLTEENVFNGSIINSRGEKVIIKLKKLIKNAP